MSGGPGSPGVDLDELSDAACKRALPLTWEAEAEADERGHGGECIYNAFDVCSSFRDGYKARAAEEMTELRTLRARVWELEQDDKELSDQLQLNAEELYRQIARAESAETRVKELEAAPFMVVSNDSAYPVVLPAHVAKMQARITDLESQLAEDDDRLTMLRATVDDSLGWDDDASREAGDYVARVVQVGAELAAAREEQGLLKSFEAMLIKRNADHERYELIELRIGCAFGEINWQGDGNDGVFATLPALLRAILDVEKAGPNET